jgi:hypothetical protein
MGISRVTAHKWVRRWRSEGAQGLHNRPSQPLTTPHRTPAATEAQGCRLRRDRKLGPARLGPVLGLPASATHRVLTRHGLNRLAFLDRPTGETIRRYERDRPGELLHVDVEEAGVGGPSVVPAVVTAAAGGGAGAGVAFVRTRTGEGRSVVSAVGSEVTGSLCPVPG